MLNNINDSKRNRKKKAMANVLIVRQILRLWHMVMLNTSDPKAFIGG